MQQSIGRDSEPTTQAGRPDARATEPESDAPESDARKRDADILRRVRDVPPAAGYEDTALSDPNAKQRSVDPLDAHKPGRPSGDPLDPDGHVI